MNQAQLNLYAAEIKSLCTGAEDPDGYSTKVECECALGDSGKVRVRVFAMYAAPVIEVMDIVSRVFKTDMIDMLEHAECGCDSCDYGSEYGWELWVTV